MTQQPPQPPREYPGMPHHMPPDPNQPQATPQQRKTLRRIMMGLGAAFVILIGLTISTHPSTPSPPPAPVQQGADTGTPASAPQLPVTTAPITKAAPTTTAAPAGPATTMPGDGTYVVGTDIVPGTYRTAGPVSGDLECYAARLKDTSGESAAIIANNLSKGPSTITIAKTDGAFETKFCQSWTKVG